MVNGEGPIPCEWLLLGEAPGAEEQKQGRPFVGASGKLLDGALDAANVRRENVYITNAYKSRPPGNRDPSEAELEEHHALLIEEFKAVDPRKVLLLGSVARRGVSGVTTVRRGEWALSEAGRWYLWVYHPAFMLHGNMSVYPDWLLHIERFFHENPGDRR